MILSHFLCKFKAHDAYFTSKPGKVHSGRPENEITKKITYYVFGKSVFRVCVTLYSGSGGETEHMYMSMACVSIRITQKKKHPHPVVEKVI